MSAVIEVVVVGALGRMGTMVLNACSADNRVRVAGALERKEALAGGAKLPEPFSSVTLTSNLDEVLSAGRVLIDFSSPGATLAALAAARRAGAKMVIGTTGLSEAEVGKVREASAEVAMVFSGNMSLGVNLLLGLVETAARTLGTGYDVEVIEAHHRLKKDAPSGTALMLAEAAARGKGLGLKEAVVYGRQGIPGARPTGEIGIHAVRGGTIVGEHTVLFAGEHERIELRHSAQNRAGFAEGAVRAAVFLAGRSSGLYTMADVLGLSGKGG